MRDPKRHAPVAHVLAGRGRDRGTMILREGNRRLTRRIVRSESRPDAIRHTGPADGLTEPAPARAGSGIAAYFVAVGSVLTPRERFRAGMMFLTILGLHVLGSAVFILFVVPAALQRLRHRRRGDRPCARASPRIRRRSHRGDRQDHRQADERGQAAARARTPYMRGRRRSRRHRPARPTASRPAPLGFRASVTDQGSARVIKQ
jgi:hypothetical protein